MNYKIVLHSLSNIWIFLAVAMLVPAGWAIYFADGDLKAFIYAILITGGVGMLMKFITPGTYEIRIRDGFAIVTLAWVSASLFSTLPFIFSGANTSFTDAFFEMMSGYTTTGASVITNVESLPRGVLFWRSLSHWLGGMGIVVLTVAILPMLGVGGMQLFKAEVPGPIDEKLTPRIKETAKILWGVYLLLTIIETALLKIGGMSLFDALCQTFGSLATGGFSTKNEGIIGFHNPFCEWVLIAFMFIGGTNFNLHYFFLRGNLKSYFRDHEFRFYLFIVLSFSLMILVVNNWNLFHLSLGAKIRHSLFQEVSIMTSTGYVSHDFELWNQTPQLLLLIVMFFGGMAGSTSGGIKMVRVFILYKQARLITRQMIHPRGVFPVRLGAKVIDDEILKQIGSFFLLYLTAFLLGSTILTLCKLDILSAISGTAACLNTCGPGLGSVGPMDNYSQVPALGKWTLSAIMLVGRLEIFTILILFSRSYWKH